jgi:hypothetical protein
MASKVFTYDINLDGNSLLNALLHPVENFPAGAVENQVVTRNGAIYLFHAGEWKAMGASVGQLQGGFDASTEVALPSGSTRGDYWFVDTAGDVDGLFDPQLEVGTMIVSLVDAADPLDLSEWVVLRIGGGQASLTEYGLVQLASVSETRAGVNNSKAVTPASLAGMKADEDDANDPLEDERFITPEALHLVTATKERRGLSRFATSAETGQGEMEDVKVSPKSIKDNTVEKELQNIHDANLMYINLVAEDLSVWRVTVSTAGVLETELISGGS